LLRFWIESADSWFFPSFSPLRWFCASRVRKGGEEPNGANGLHLIRIRFRASDGFAPIVVNQEHRFQRSSSLCGGPTLRPWWVKLVDKYCGKSAGFFHREHAECEEQHHERDRLIQAGRERMATEVSLAIRGLNSFDGLETNLAVIEQAFLVPSTERRSLLITGWEKSVEQLLEDGVLDAAEETRLVEFKERFALSQDELNSNGALTKTAKAGVLREVLSGAIPQRASFDANLPINLQKGEQIV
jgi:hypothetical protein